MAVNERQRRRKTPPCPGGGWFAKRKEPCARPTQERAGEIYCPRHGYTGLNYIW